MLESSISPTLDFRLRLQTARAHSMTYIFRQICILLYELLKTLVGLFEQKRNKRLRARIQLLVLFGLTKKTCKKHEVKCFIF